MARLLAAMSGGVDSSVAAALMVREGHEVVGATLKQWEFPDEETRLSKGCCTLDAVADARRAAEIIGIPHYTFDFRDVFRREVVEPFVREYASGRTPNPCIRCNEIVRFGTLVRKAEMLGFEGVVTGHYARVVGGERLRLLRPVERAKDQTYVLHSLGQDALARAHFPLGDTPSKDAVRSLARDLGLPNWNRADSVEVCFVGSDRTPGDVVAEEVPGAVRRGPIVDRDGNVVGEHRGIAHYTVGQRRGLGPIGPEPHYVQTVDASTNTLVVGEAPEAWGLSATRPRFVSGHAPSDGSCVDAVIRYQAEPVPATFTRTTDGFTLDFAEPVRAVAPGQSAVIYDGDEVLGGGTISRAH